MYHTQESRSKKLVEPALCEEPDAWLGNAYYFWDQIHDAVQWGQKKKKETGSKITSQKSTNYGKLLVILKNLNLYIQKNQE